MFRFPPGRNLFCALVGTGTQLFWLSIYIFALSCVGAFAPYSRGSMYTALIVLYALTAGIAGYTAGSYYKQMGGTAWVRADGPAVLVPAARRGALRGARARAQVRNTLLTCIVFCGPFFVAFCVNNTIAIAYGVRPAAGRPAHAAPRLCAEAGSRARAQSTAAFPFGTIVIIAVIWCACFCEAPPDPPEPVRGPDACAGRALVTIPLTILGCIIGKNTRTEFKAPCRTTKCARAAPAPRPPMLL